MRFVLDVEGHVSHHTVGRCRDDIHCAQVGALLGQDGGHLCKHAGFVGELETNGQAVVGIGPNVSHGWSLLFYETTTRQVRSQAGLCVVVFIEMAEEGKSAIDNSGPHSATLSPVCPI